MQDLGHQPACSQEFFRMIGLVENDLMILDHEWPAWMEAIGWRQMVGQKYIVMDGSKGPVDHRKPCTYIVQCH